MASTVARRRPEARRRLTWPAGAPRVGLHLGVQRGLLRAARRSRQVGATALQVFADNPIAWRRRPEPPSDGAEFIEYAAQEGLAPIAIHASYLINLAGSAEPLATQSRAGLIAEMQSAAAIGATLVNCHIGSHRGTGRETGLRRIVETVGEVVAESPVGVRLVLENASGGGDTLGSTIEELAAIFEGVAGFGMYRIGFCLDTAHLWGAGYDVSTEEGAMAVIDRFADLIGLEHLALVHLNDSRSVLGSRADRHEHVGAGRIGPLWLGTFVRDPRLRHATFIMETPGADEGWDAANVRRVRALFDGATELPELPPKAFTTSRRSTRVVR